MTYIQLTNQMRTEPVRGSGYRSGSQIWISLPGYDLSHPIVGKFR
jgi:hypothetical protein